MIDGFIDCCWSRVFITSRGWRRTHDTNPLRLPAIKWDVGILIEYDRPEQGNFCSLSVKEMLFQGVSDYSFPGMLGTNNFFWGESLQLGDLLSENHVTSKPGTVLLKPDIKRWQKFVQNFRRNSQITEIMGKGRGGRKRVRYIIQRIKHAELCDRSVMMTVGVIQL